MRRTPTPYDALLLVSFGGPEKPDDVVPFLRNVTEGRDIPDERLEEVGEHYFELGGRSPINDQNRVLIEAVETDLEANGVKIPVYWGNRNWDPYLRDALAQMKADGDPARRGAADQRLLLLQRLPAVPRGPRRRGRQRCPALPTSTGCAPTSTTPASWSRWWTPPWPRSPTCPRRPAAAATSSSSPTRSRWR